MKSCGVRDIFAPRWAPNVPVWIWMLRGIARPTRTQTSFPWAEGWNVVCLLGRRRWALAKGLQRSSKYECERVQNKIGMNRVPLTGLIFWIYIISLLNFR